jgi:hypothetical protein
MATWSERETAFRVEVPKTTAAAAPFGTVAGFQLAAVFQSPLPGEDSQVCALADGGQKTRSNADAASTASPSKCTQHRKRMPETDSRPNNKFAFNVRSDSGP